MSEANQPTDGTTDGQNNEMEKKEQVKGQADSEMKSNDDKKS